MNPIHRAALHDFFCAAKAFRILIECNEPARRAEQFRHSLRVTPQSHGCVHNRLSRLQFQKPEDLVEEDGNVPGIEFGLIHQWTRE